MELFRTIRGVKVKIIADEFSGDESVGIGYGPEVLYAETMDGEPFELTDKEAMEISGDATESYLEPPDYDPSEWY